MSNPPGAAFLLGIVRRGFVKVLKARKAQREDRNLLRIVNDFMREEIEEHIEQSWGVGEGEL